MKKLGKGRYYQRNKTWYIDVWVNGKRIRKAVGSKSQAMEVLDAIQKTMVLESLGITLPQEKKPVETRFNELCEDYLEYAEDNHRNSTFKREFEIIKTHLAPYFKDILLTDMTPRMIEEFKMKRLSKAAKVTVFNELKQLTTMLNKAVRWYDLPENPMDKVDRVKYPRREPIFLETEEFGKFLAGCEVEFKPLAAACLYAGLRRNEAFNLKKSDVDFRRGVIRIRAEVAKNGRMRVIPMHPYLRNILEVQARRYPKTVWMFPGRYGDNKRATCQTAMKRARERSGVDPRLRLHDLRHSWASGLLEAGVDPMKVKEWGGWHSIKMLDIYAHVTRSKKKSDQAIALLGSDWDESDQE